MTKERLQELRRLGSWPNYNPTEMYDEIEACWEEIEVHAEWRRILDEALRAAELPPGQDEQLPGAIQALKDATASLVTHAEIAGGDNRTLTATHEIRQAGDNVIVVEQWTCGTSTERRYEVGPLPLSRVVHLVLNTTEKERLAIDARADWRGVDDAYAAVRAERARQVAKGRTADKDDARSPGDWMRCLDLVLQGQHAPRALWAKVGSVAVAALESLARKEADAGLVATHGMPSEIAPAEMAVATGDEAAAPWTPAVGDRVRLVRKIACTAPVGSEGIVTMSWSATDRRPAEYCVVCSGHPAFVTEALSLEPARAQAPSEPADPSAPTWPPEDAWPSAISDDTLHELAVRALGRAREAAADLIPTTDLPLDRIAELRRILERAFEILHGAPQQVLVEVDDIGRTDAPVTAADLDEVERLARGLSDPSPSTAAFNRCGYHRLAEIAPKLAAEVRRLHVSEACCVRAALAEVGALKAELSAASAELEGVHAALAALGHGDRTRSFATRIAEVRAETVEHLRRERDEVQRLKGLVGENPGKTSLDYTLEYVSKRLIPLVGAPGSEEGIAYLLDRVEQMLATKSAAADELRELFQKLLAVDHAARHFSESIGDDDLDTDGSEFVALQDALDAIDVTEQHDGDMYTRMRIVLEQAFAPTAPPEPLTQIAALLNALPWSSGIPRRVCLGTSREATEALAQYPLAQISTFPHTDRHGQKKMIHATSCVISGVCFMAQYSVEAGQS